MSDGEGFTMNKTVTTIMTLLIGSIIVMAIFIPFVLDTVNEHDPDVTVDSGGTWSYTPVANLSATFSISGISAQYVEYEAGTFSIAAPDGDYRITIKAVSENPYQTAEQTFVLRFGEHSLFDDVSPLLLIIPVMVIIGLIIFALRGMGVTGKFGNRDPYDYDNY